MARRDASHQALGGKLGPRIAELVTDSMSSHMAATAQHRAKVHAEGLNEFFRGMTREKRQHITPFTELFLGGENTPPEIETLLRFVSHGKGEASELLNMLGVGSALGTSISAGIANYLAPFNQRIIRENPYALLDPGTIAQTIVRGIDYGEAADEEAARGGINANRLGALVALAEQFPAIGELLELWRRDVIAEPEVEHALARTGIATGWAPRLMALKREHLAPADAALATLRSIISEDEGAEIAAKAGIDAHDFSLMVKNTGEPPGLMQLLEAYRREFINDERLRKGISQSRVRNEWSDVVEKLRFSPGSTADAVAALVQGHLSEDEAKQIAAWNGLRPEDFDWLHETYGSPASPTQMDELWNRGYVSQEQVEQAYREGRTKDKYISPLLHLKEKMPEVRQVIKMIGTGAVTPARGAELMRHQGYSAENVEALIHSATSGQVVKEKELAIGQISELYHDKAITEGDALAYLRTIGVHEANAKLILAIIDLKRERTLLEAAVKALRPAYVSRHINQSEVSIAMDKLKVPPEQRDFYLELWAIERANTRKVLTAEQVQKAYKKKLITAENAAERLESLGYSKEDAELLVDIE